MVEIVEREDAIVIMLTRPAALNLPVVAETVFDRLVLEVDPNDQMYGGNDGHYLSVGASALNVIAAALQIADVRSVNNILDFGSGAGRVARWLRCAYPSAEMTVTDVREADLDFCVSKLGAKKWHSGTDIDALKAPGTYDLIWVGSVLTHLSAERSLRLLHKLIDWTRDRGVVVVTLHGRMVIRLRSSGRVQYIYEEGWQQVMSGYERDGYGYADYPGQDGYGLSLTALEWIGREVARLPDVRLLLASEHAWDGHHDVVALQRGQM